jgi:outer membrane receptor protein involved in Fe transport
MSIHKSKWKISPLSTAISFALGITPFAFAEDTETSSRAIEEVLVTARKRSESIMDIPASVQALTGDDLKEMGARGLSDYSRFMPGVTVLDYGAGSATVVFRGATTSAGYVGESTSAVYLDELSMSTSGQQPSIRMVDIARVEALEGPQGTLYGADSQAGTLKVITNKPEMNVSEVILDGSFRNGSEGEGSYDGSIVINTPLIEDKLTARLVAYKAKDGGFVDNVYGHTIDNDQAAPNGTPSGWGTLDNADVVADDTNDYNLTGWRAALRWEINDNWAATASYLTQKSESGSYSAYDPNVGDLQAIRYNPEFYDNEYDVSSLVIEGDLEFAQFISATSYYKSNTSYNTDVTNYHRNYSAYYCIAQSTYGGVYGGYYYSPDGGENFIYNGKYCSAPTIEGDYLAAFYEDDKSDRFSQEIRLSSQGDTYDWLIGAFYEESNYSWADHFGYPTVNENTPRNTDAYYYEGSVWQDSVSAAWYEWNDGVAYPNATEHWYSNSSTDTEQTAIFGEATWHMNDKIDITLGLRYFDRENSTDYFEEHPTGNLEADPNTVDGITRTFGQNDEFVPKVSVSYDMSEDSMVYGLWTIGYRPGGSNRERGEPFFPKQYDADKMSNYEVGYKGSFADGAGNLYLSAYRMAWEDYQYELVDPSYTPCPDGEAKQQAGVCGQPWQIAIFNAGDAHIDGVSVYVDYNPTENLSVGFNLYTLDSQTDDDLSYGGTFIPEGSRLPLSAELSGSLWATYNWPVPSLNANGYARIQWSYEGSRLSQLEATPLVNDDGTFAKYPQFNDPSYNIGDLHMGVQGSDWEFSFFVNNVTDERANYGHEGYGGYSQQNLAEGRMHVDYIYTNRPREYGIRYVKSFGGK